MIRIFGGIGLLGIVACIAPTPAAQVDADAPAGQPTGYPLWLWLRGDSAAAASAGLEVVSHPCGYAVQTHIARLTNSEPHAEAELVLEFDAAGLIVRRWLMPIDVMVAAVQDSLLFVPYEVEGATAAWHYLAIAPSGHYRVVTAAPRAVAENLEQCPEFAEFAGSAFVICQRWTDGSMREPQTIAYQAVCT